jgi:hypothetical protein
MTLNPQVRYPVNADRQDVGVDFGKGSRFFINSPSESKVSDDRPIPRDCGASLRSTHPTCFIDNK